MWRQTGGAKWVKKKESWRNYDVLAISNQTSDRGMKEETTKGFCGGNDSEKKEIEISAIVAKTRKRGENFLRDKKLEAASG